MTTKYKGKCLLSYYMEQVKYPLNKHQCDQELIKHSSAEEFLNEILCPLSAVYVFYNHHTGFCKIGISNNVKTRQLQLCTASGCSIDKLLVIYLNRLYDESNKVIETHLHTFFKEKRKIGEWFKLSLSDLIQIRDLFWYINGEEIEDEIRETIEYYKNVPN